MQTTGSLKIIFLTFQTIKENFLKILFLLIVLCVASFFHYEKPTSTINFLQIFEQNYANYDLKFYEKLYLKSYNPTFRTTLIQFAEILFKIVISFCIILIIDKRMSFFDSIISSATKIPTFLIASILAIPLVCFPILLAYLFFLFTSNLFYQIFILLISVLFVFFYIARFCLYFYCVAVESYNPIECLQSAFSYSRGNANAIMTRSFMMFLFTTLTNFICWIFFRDIRIATLFCVNFNLIFLVISHYFIFKTLKDRYEAVTSS